MNLALAFDIGGTNVRAGLVDEDGAVVAQLRATVDDRSPAGVAAVCTRLGHTLESQTSGGSVVAVGAGLAAMIDARSGRVEVSPNLGWRNVDFASALSQALGGRSVSLLNDLDAICLGEVAAGAAQGATDAVCVYIGTGVGSGFVLRGEPYAGFRGVGAELGHIKVAGVDGRDCGCGARGCLEAYAGGRQWTQRIRRELRAKPELSPALHTHTDTNFESVELSDVDAIATTNPWADAMWSEVSTLLGVAVANLVTVLNPEVLVLGGGVWDKCPALRQRTRQVVQDRTNGVALVELRVVDATAGDAAGLIGAGTFALKR